MRYNYHFYCTFKLKTSLEETEYLLSNCKGIQFFEVYDFNNDYIYFDCIDTPFGSMHNIKKIIAPHFKLKEDSNLYLIGFMSSIYDLSGNKISDIINLKQVSFNSIDIKNEPPSIEKEIYENSDDSQIFSLFQTKLKYIICFFKDDNHYYSIIVYSEDLDFKKNYNYLFFKCAYFYKEIEVFTYYSNDDLSLLNFTFKKYNSESIDDYTSSISIEDYSFSKSMTLNDIIKVFDKKIIFVTTSSDKKI